MTPLLWLDGLVFAGCVTLLVETSDPGIRVFSMWLIGTAFVLTCGIYVYFAFRDPNLLQSENYQLRHRALNMLQQQGGPISIQPASLNAITSAEATFFPGGSEDE